MPVTRYRYLRAEPGVDLQHESPAYLSALNYVGQQLGKVLDVFSGARLSGKPGTRWANVGFPGDPHDYSLGPAGAADVNVDGRPIGTVPGAMTAIRRAGLVSGNQPGFYQGKPDPAHVQRASGARVRASTGAVSYAQLMQLWIRAGGPQRLAPVMAAIALAESGGDPNAESKPNRDGSIDRGLWQINSVHGYPPNLLFDPAYNAQAAVSIYKSQGLGAWTTYKTGAYESYLGAAAPTVVSSPRTRPDTGPATGGGGGGVTGFLGGAAGGLESAGESLWKGLLGPIGSPLDVFKAALWLLSPGSWLRMVEFATGLLLMLLGLVGLGVIFVQRSGIVGDAAELAATLPGPAGVAGKAVTVARAPRKAARARATQRRGASRRDELAERRRQRADDEEHYRDYRQQQRLDRDAERAQAREAQEHRLADIRKRAAARRAANDEIPF